METETSIALAAVVIPIVALLGWGVAFIWAVNRDMRQGDQPRRELWSRLNALPLRQVLEHVGIDPLMYLYGEQFVDIERHLRTCSACDAAQRCATQLHRGSCAELHFCPNYPALRARRERYAARLHAAS